MSCVIMLIYCVQLTTFSIVAIYPNSILERLWQNLFFNGICTFRGPLSRKIISTNRVRENQIYRISPPPT